MKKSAGFTIVELLIVIVVIGILAAIVIVAYNGIQNRAHDTSVASDINQAAKLVESYYAINGEYPKTGNVTIAGSSTNDTVYTDTGCPIGTARSDWIPGVPGNLPKSDHNTRGGVASGGGCYIYQSDGKSYVLSAWNMLKNMQNSTMYRRLGFREMSNAPFYYCNQTNIGGNNPTPYTATKDIYKYSYTVSNITFCNETPPTGA